MICRDKGYEVNGGGMINMKIYGELCHGINPLSIELLFHDLEVTTDDGFTPEQIETARNPEEMQKAKDWVYKWLTDE